MIYRLPYQWRTGQTLSPARLAQIVRELRYQVVQRQRHQYHYSSIRLDWSNTVAGTAVSRPGYTLTLPYDTDITDMYVAARVFGTAGTTYTITVNVANVILTIAGTVPAAGYDDVVATSNTPRHIAAGSNLVTTASWSSSASIHCDILQATLSVRTSRRSTDPSYAEWTLDETAMPRGGAVSSNTALNAELAKAAAAVASGLQGCFNLQVCPLVAVASGALASGVGSFRSPAGRRTLRGLQIGVACPGTSSWTATVVMPGSSNTTATVTGTGSTSTAVSAVTAVTKTETSSDVSDTSRDTTIALTRTSGTDATPLVYAVLYWS